MELANWETVRIQEQSDIEDVDLLYAEFSNEEYIHTEIYEGMSVMWSSQSKLSAVIEAAHTHMGIAKDMGNYWSRVVFKDGTDQEMNPARIERIALERESNVTYYTGAYGEGLLSWTAPKTKMIGGLILHSEICYTETPPRLEAILNLISATATPRVISAIETDSSPLAQKVSLAL